MFLKKKCSRRNNDNLEIINILNILVDDDVEIKTSKYMPNHIDSSVLMAILRTTGSIMIHPDQLEELHFIESKFEVT